MALFSPKDIQRCHSEKQRAKDTAGASCNCAIFFSGKATTPSSIYIDMHAKWPQIPDLSAQIPGYRSFQAQWYVSGKRFLLRIGICCACCELGIASTVALRPNGMSLAARSCWGSEFAKGLLRAGVFEAPVWGSRGLIVVGSRLCSLCRSMGNHAPMIWQHWSATGPHFNPTADQGQVSGEHHFDPTPWG